MNYSILVVDDNPDDVFMVKRAIVKSRSDCVVETAADGPLALTRLGEGQPPALVLLDIKMPGMSGIEVLHALRANARTRYLSVVILSSSDLEQDLQAAYDAGASGFLHKTHDLTAFTEQMKVALQYWIDFNRSPTLPGR